MAAPILAKGLYELGAYFFGMITSWWIATHPLKIPSAPSTPSQSQQALKVEERLPAIAQEQSRKAIDAAERLCGCVPLCDVPVGTVCWIFNLHAEGHTHFPCRDPRGGHMHMLISTVTKDCICNMRRLSSKNFKDRYLLCISAKEVPFARTLVSTNHPSCAAALMKKKNGTMV